jgi:hypothetical protein
VRQHLITLEQMPDRLHRAAWDDRADAGIDTESHITSAPPRATNRVDRDDDGALTGSGDRDQYRATA